MYMSTMVPFIHLLKPFIHIQCMKNFINYNQYSVRVWWQCQTFFIFLLFALHVLAILHSYLYAHVRVTSSSAFSLFLYPCLYHHAIILDNNNRDDDLFASYACFFSAWVYNGNDLQHSEVRNEVIALFTWAFCWILVEYVSKNDGIIVFHMILLLTCIRCVCQLANVRF